MANPWDYTTNTTYARLKAQLEERRRQERERIQQAIEVIQPPSIPSPFEDPLGFLGQGVKTGLELVGRPGRAVTSGIGAGLAGRDILGGMAQGLRGEGPITGMESVLAQQGIEEGPGLQTPLGKLTARGAAGFLGDILTDPITWMLPGWKPTSLLARGGVRAAEVVGAGGMKEALSVAQTTKSMFGQPTAIQQLARTAAAKIPGFGGIMERISPVTVANTPMKQSVVALDAVIQNIPNQVGGLTAEMQTVARPKAGILTHLNPLAENAKQKILLGDGTRMNWYDAFLNAFKVALTPEQRVIQQKAVPAWKTLYDHAKEVGVDMGEWQLKEGQEFLPRLWIPANPRLRTTFIEGIEQGVQKERHWAEAAQGLAAGFVLADFPTTMQVKFGQIMRAIAYKNFARELEPLAQRGIKKAMKEAGLQTIKGVDVLKGMWFKAADAAVLEKALIQKMPAALKPLQDLNALSRTVTASLDYSGGMIQGLVLLARDPVSWFKAQWLAAKVLLDPMKLSEFMASPQAQRVRQMYPNLAIGAGSQEFFAAAKPGGLLGKTLFRVPRVGGIAQETFGRAGASFDAVGDGLRVMYGDAMSSLVKSPEDAYKIGEYLNKATGAFMTPGLSKGQRAFEGSMLLFAPRYTRSMLALASDIFSGGIAGDQARKSLASMLVVGPWMYSKVTTALGQEPNYDPTDSRFLTMKVGNDVVGIGTIWVATAKLLGRLITEPERALALDTTNPIVAWWRSRGSPMGSAALDMLVFNSSYIGEPLDNPINIGKYLGGKLMPFALEAYLLQEPRGDIAGLPAQLTGFRVIPQNYRERRDALAQQVHQKSYEDLTPVEQVELSQRPELQELPLPKGKAGERQTRIRQIQGDYVTQLEELANMVEEGTRSKRDFREYQTELAKIRSHEYTQLEAEIPVSGKAKYTPLEAKRQQYLSYFKTGRPYDEAAFDEAESFLASLAPEEKRYIEDKQAAALGRLDPKAKALMEDLRSARDILKPYWDVRNEVMARFGIMDDWNNMTPTEQDAFIQTPRYKRAQAVWNRERKLLRRRKPVIDAALIDWGYAEVPIRKQG